MKKYEIHYGRPVGATAKIIEARMNVSCLTDVSSEIEFTGKRSGDTFNLVYKTPHEKSGGRVSLILNIKLVEKEGGTEIIICMQRSKFNYIATAGLSIVVALAAMCTLVADNKAGGIATTLIFGSMLIFSMAGSINLYQCVLIGIQDLLIKDANKQI